MLKILQTDPEQLLCFCIEREEWKDIPLPCHDHHHYSIVIIVHILQPVMLSYARHPLLLGEWNKGKTAGHWTEKQRNRGRMECTLAIKMRIEVLKRKPNSTRILDYLTFLTLTLNSIEDLKIKFFPFTTKPRDAAQKSQKPVNLEMWNLNHTGWGGSRLRSQRSNSSYKEFPSIALLPRSPWTFRQRYREFPHIV